MTHRIFCYILGIMVLLSCSGNDDNAMSLDEYTPRKATVTLMVTPNGLGDNGYNDAAAEGFFAFGKETGTWLRLLLPKDYQEAEQMYRHWLTDNADQDSAVLILGSSEYEQMARQNSRFKYQDSTKSGCRVLLFESNARIEGVSTVMVSHYGVSYLAGAMSQNFNTLILAATPGIPALEESIAGFNDARELYAGSQYDMPCKTMLQYLADSEAGFAMPDSAYRHMARLEDEEFMYDEMIFPLLGGSEAGVLRFLNDNEFTSSLMIGMDIDQTGQSSRIPFSVVIRIGDVLNRYLNDWLSGQEWPAGQKLGMKDGAADIVITTHFFDNLIVFDQRYEDPDTFQHLYEQHKDEAIKKEIEYERN